MGMSGFFLNLIKSIGNKMWSIEGQSRLLIMENGPYLKCGGAEVELNTSKVYLSTAPD